MEEEKILNVTQLGVVDKLQNEDVILLIRNTDNGKQCFQIKGFDFRGESAYEAALSQGFEGTYQDWVQHIKEITEYDTKSLLSFNGIANNDANSALRSGIYPSVTKNVPINGETFTIQTLRTTTAVYNQYVSTQIALGVTGAATGKVYIRKNTQKSGKTTYEDWIKISNETSTTKKSKPKTQYIIGKAIPIGKLNGGARLNAYAVRFGNFRFKLSNVPQIRHLFSNGEFSIDAVHNLLEGVTWHVFIDDDEVYTGPATTNYGGGVLYIYIKNATSDIFYKLDESKSSVDLSSDMYIYLMSDADIDDKNCTSKTLFYFNGKRIWKPAFESPYMSTINHDNFLRNTHSGCMQIKKLHTTQDHSSKSNSAGAIHVRSFRGKFYRAGNGYGGYLIDKFGIYRYRLVKNGKKAQWRTISIMTNDYDCFSIK